MVRAERLRFDGGEGALGGGGAPPTGYLHKNFT
jgi:hypothetical protein